MTGRPCKKARRMNTRNRPSSTQEELVDTDSENESEQSNDLTTTRATATIVNENTPPPLTQNTANVVEALFMIKAEERHEFLHNSANAHGFQELEDGTKVWGMTQEQREAENSTILQQYNENNNPQQQQLPQQQVPRIAPVNPYTKPKAVNPQNSTLAIATNSTTIIPFSPAPTTATTAAVLPSGVPPEDDSDEDIVSFLANNMIEDDCMLFTEEERATIGTKRGKNDNKYEDRKVAIEFRFFETAKDFGGPHVQPLLEIVPAKYCDERKNDFRFYNALCGDRSNEKQVILNKFLTLCGMKWVALSGARKGEVLEPRSFQYYIKLLFYVFKDKGIKYDWKKDFDKKGEFQGVMITYWENIRKTDPLFGTSRNQAHFDEEAVS